jgi:hypothetical protein
MQENAVRRGEDRQQWAVGHISEQHLKELRVSFRDSYLGSVDLLLKHLAAFAQKLAPEKWSEFGSILKRIRKLFLIVRLTHPR